MDGYAIIPQAPGSEGFVVLSRSKQGKVFEKHILNFGTLLYPGVAGGKVNINDSFAKQLVDNFNAGVCDIVQVPVAGEHNEHTEDPFRNIGEVVGLTVRDKKIYAQIDVRDEQAAEKLGKTLLGASAMLSLNYTNTATGQKVGPTLLHVAVTNRPYVTGLDDFEEILAATSVGSIGADGTSDAVVLTAPTTTEEKMDLADIKAELLADHGIDLDGLQARAALVDSAVALTNSVRDSLTEQNMLVLSAGSEPTAEDMVKAISDAGEKIVALTAKVDEIETEARKKDAEAHVDGLVRSGHILPKNRDAQVTLLLSNPDLFDALLPENPIIRLSAESGSDPVDPTPAENVDSEVERLSTLAASRKR